MKNVRRFTSGAAALALLTLMILTSCTVAPTPAVAPTMNAETLVAAAVKTLGAQMTEEAIRNPSATPTSTSTPVPTATKTPVPPTATSTVPAETATPTATTAPAVSAKFLTASTYPENKSTYASNERFSVSVRFMNTGTIDWPPGSQLKLTGFEGEITVQTEAVVNRGIAPGEVIEFDLWAFGSETPGKHVWYFQLYTASGIPVPGGFGYYTYTSG